MWGIERQLKSVDIDHSWSEWDCLYYLNELSTDEMGAEIPGLIGRGCNLQDEVI